MFCNLKTPDDYTLEKVGLTQSKIKTFLQCPLKFLFTVNRLYPVGVGGGEQGKTTGFGSIFHQVLENVYNGYKESKQFPSEDDVTKWVDDYINDEENNLSYDTLEQDALTVETMTPYYIRFYKNDFRKMEIVQAEKEVKYLWEVESGSYMLRGKIDLILRSGKYNYSLDHKTHGKIVEDNIVRLISIDYQHQFYTLIIENLLGLRVSGSYHNVIRRPEYRFDGSFDNFRNKLKKELEAKPDHFFKRFVVNFSAQDKIDYSEELETVISDIRDHLEGRRKYYHNVNSCIYYGACPYLDACVSNSTSGYDKGGKFFPELDDQGDCNASCKKGVKKRVLRKK